MTLRQHLGRIFLARDKDLEPIYLTKWTLAFVCFSFL